LPVSVVVLAAGEGTRMRSVLPKVLHPVGGRPILAHVLDTAEALDPVRTLVVHGDQGDRLQQALRDANCHWVHQARRLGTGHAVQQALTALDADDTLLVLYGDVPLLEAETVRRLLEALPAGGLTLLTAELTDPSGYGRVIRDAGGEVTRIVEEHDADEGQRQVREVNTGILAGRAGDLGTWLQRVGSDNAQGEYYLTDCIGLAVSDGRTVRGIAATDADEVLGINDRRQLAQVERAYQRRQGERLMAEGASLMDPARFDCRGRVRCGRDVVIDVDVVLEGEVELGDGVYVGPYTHISDSRLARGVQVEGHSVVASADVGEDCRIGPFARVRPGTSLGDGVHVGNFVEVKKSRVGPGSKINHLSYVGDAEVGQRVNIGAGTITCNYDGARKHTTTIGDDAFIGSSTQLVAPVTVGEGATIGAGSTITRDAPAGELTLSRARQSTIKGWQRPKK